MRLIDADELRIEVQRAGMRISGNSAFNKLLLKVYDEAVNECEEVDAVPVVRCKDCKHLSMTTLGMPYACWHKAEGIWGQDGTHANDVVCTSIDDIEHYCAYGERKTDGNDDNE